MKKPQVLLAMVPWIFILFLVLPFSSGQLLSSERRILFRLQELLEYPYALQGWTNWTNFCDLAPSSSLKISCSGSHITELIVIGNKPSTSLSPKPTQETFRVSQQTLSEKFSIYTFLTVLTKLSSLKVLSLVSLGMWGSLPAKINRFDSLQVLNLSSNFIYGEIPPQIATLENLRSLVLADNLFKGMVPDLSTLAVLEEVNVGGNSLGPKFPTLGSKVVSVILRNNSFSSEIPSELKNFYQLQRWDVSSNGIIGTIPLALFSLPSIKYIDLAGNDFRGSLPRNISCSDGLKFVDLSENFLVGDLPKCIRYNSSDRIMKYTGNCLSTGDLNYQHPISFCYEKALAVKPPMQNQKKQSASKKGVTLGIIGAIVGSVVVLGLVVLVILWKVRVRETKNDAPQNSVAGKSSVGLSPKLVTDARNVSPTMMFGALGLPQYHVFSLEEIEEATNNFDSSNLIGEGAQGQLYKGWLIDGTAVVVRCLKLKQKHSSQTMVRQMEVLSKLQHQHLVSILGHSLNTDQDHPNAADTLFLVFEYVSNGTLRSHLTDSRKRDALKWSERMAVTIGVARGIQFLYSGVTPGLFGNNLKTENILLDENVKAKIKNYNLPLSSLVSSESPYNGEDTPDNHHKSYMHTAKNGERQDVYQLGVILLEVITGKQITLQSELDKQKIQLEQGLLDTPLELQEWVDPFICGTFAYESLRNTVEVALNCLSKDLSQRPSVEDVLWNLQYSVQVQEGWRPSSASFGTQF
ncbi:hypothetical protein IFM89_036096 [Coptis chinensis]|uniref:non-specific serine/threonine protein kinase n=1 Tax=Coptis chinensis TaxID=261450 RepID=A0A835IYS6_9MAGN|nr:hypothetical protein IFM89_036096 [Coptis chinensis]